MDWNFERKGILFKCQTGTSWDFNCNNLEFSSRPTVRNLEFITYSIYVDACS